MAKAQSQRCSQEGYFACTYSAEGYHVPMVRETFASRQRIDAVHRAKMDGVMQSLPAEERSPISTDCP